jgi:hypothetical protein
MRTFAFIGPAVVALALFTGRPGTLDAQVVEARESESNPATVLFRSTLYGAGTGLVVTGAYSLIDNDDVGERLRWGTAIGAGAGLLVGLVHLATRSEAEENGPAGGLESSALLRVQEGSVRVAVPAVTSTLRDLPGAPLRTLDLELMSVRF